MTAEQIFDKCEELFSQNGGEILIFEYNEFSIEMIEEPTHYNNRGTFEIATLCGTIGVQKTPAIVSDKHNKYHVYFYEPETESVLSNVLKHLENDIDFLNMV